MLALLALLISLIATGSALADTTVPDPTLHGPLSVNKVEYYGGSVMMSAPNISGASTAAFQQPLDGALFYPSGPGPYPVVVLLHGNHSDCLTLSTGAESSPQPCAPPNVPILNYEGYDYIGDNLASHGYVVLSLDADALTSYQTSQDNGTYLRTQLISASLDMVYNWEDGAPLYVQTSPGVVQTSPTLAPSPYALAGKINLAQGVGVWGHSRGGEGAAEFPAYNRSRPAPGKKYKISGVMAFAPVDYERAAVFGTQTTDVNSATNNSKPGYMPFAAVLPMCDGDVSNLHGARIFMNSLFAEPGDPSPKMQFAFQGGDHDYTNTIWASSGSEDGAGYSSTNLGGTTRSDTACGEDQPNNIRLTPVEQQNYSLGITAAFFRRYVGGETAFDPLMTGAAPLPAGMCPKVRGVSCDQEEKTTYFSGADQRTDVIDPDPNTGLDADALGGKLSGTGFQSPYQSQYCVGGTCEPAGTPVQPTTPQGYDWCDPEPVEFRVTSGFPTAAKPCPLPPAGTSGVFDPVAFGGQANERESDPVNRSFGPQLSLAWDGPAQLDAEIPASDGDLSARKVLAFDVGVDYFDSRNPASGADNPIAQTDPTAAMQDFDVKLTDSAGHSATVDAADPDYGTALEPSLGTSRRHVLLNEVRIPLADFGGVDVTHLAKVSLVFGGKQPSGAIQLADMRFQESATMRAADPVVGGNAGSSPLPPVPSVRSAVSVSTTPASSTNPDAIPLDGTNVLKKAMAACADTTAPHTVLGTLSMKRGRLMVTGKASDHGCAATAAKKSTKGKVRRVQISLSVPAKGGKCRFVTASGKLTAPHPCTALYALVAHGTTGFSLKLPRLKAGTYRLSVQGIDAAGNLEPAHGHLVRVANGTTKVVR